jgi:hypothetical protein
MFCAATVVVGVTAAPAQPQDPTALRVLFAATQTPAGAIPLPQTKSFVAARVDFDALSMANAGDRFDLDVASGATLTAVVGRIERRSASSYSVFGALEGLDHSSFIIAVENGAVAADITCAPRGLHYRLKSAGNGVHLVCDVDDGAYAPCLGSRPPVNLPDEDVVPEADAGLDAPPDGEWQGACANVQTVFDAMVVYSDRARDAAGGDDDIHAEIQLAVDRTNEAYANSPIAARYRLVHREMVLYNEVGTYDDHLDRLTSNGGGPWPGVRATRDAVNADFCTLWVDDSDACGLAWCTSSNGSAYSVVTWHCAAGNLSHAHEIGHNQGCEHDPDNSGCGGAFSYSFGHRFLGSDANEYRTVMAYDPGTRIPFFSNPNVTFLGTPTGTATRDNTRSINDRRFTCEAFQTTRYDIWLDFANGGTQNGTFANPYDNVATGVANLDGPGVGATELPNLYIKSGATSWTGTLSNAMRISTCGGAVTIGD